MHKRFIFVLFMSLTLFACSKTNSINHTEITKADDASLQTNEKTYWVNSLKSKCAGTGSMECLQIQQGNELKPDGWTLYHSTIQGFEYEPGYIYKIIVAEQPVISKQAPADKSLINYHLVKVIKKNRDDSLRLNDIWALETIKGETLNLKNGERPKLEINLREKKILGIDGCNNFTGVIKSLDANKVIFGAIATTRKLCIDMDVSDRFHQYMNNVQSYSLKALKLHFYDKEGIELFVFQKID